jgi:hypothetical protein
LKCGAGEKSPSFSWADPVRSEEVLQRVKEDRNIFRTIK